MSNVQSGGESSRGHAHDSTLTDGDRPVERRRNGSSADSPDNILKQLPAVVVLERLPVPTLAMTRDGVILFANTAFAEMVGYEQDELAGMESSEIFHPMPAGVDALFGADAVANLVVELQNREGWTVKARISRSALMRHDDPIMLVTFANLTEQLWVDERASG